MAQHQFQHETLLALQDALARLARTTAQTYLAGVDEFNREGTWGRELLPEALNTASHEAVIGTNRLWVRARDKSIRSGARQMIDYSTLIAEPAPRDAPIPHTKARDAGGRTFDSVIALHREVNERIGEVLRAESS